VVRGRRRTVSAILGVLLAITFIAGTFIAIDSSTRATLNGLLAGYPADLFFQAQPSANATHLKQAVEAVPGVVRVATYHRASFDEIQAVSPPNATVFSVNILGVEPGYLPSDLGSIMFTQGSDSLARGTVALSERLAEMLLTAVGDPVAILGRVGDQYNVTTTRVNVTVGALFRGASLGHVSSGTPLGTPGREFVLIPINDIEWYDLQLGTDAQYEIGGEIQINREALLDPYDLERSRLNVAHLSRQVDAALATFGGSVTSDQISNALSNFESVLTFQRAIYLALSAPVILLGLYLGAIGVDLGHAERRRELAVLKTRGAGTRQLFGLLLTEAAVGGVLAGIVGLAAGVALSLLLLNFVTPFGLGTGSRYGLPVFSASTIVTVVVMSVIFMAVMSFRSAHRTAALPIVETLRHYAPGETKIHYRPTIDIVLIVLAVATYGLVLYSRSRPGGFLTFLVGPLFFILLPFSPIFLILGSTRLLTRSTGRLYEGTARLAKPFAKNLYHVIAKNLQRNPRRSSNVAVVIALGIAFGMFMLVTFASQLAHQEIQVRGSIGADAAVVAQSSDATFETNLSHIAGVVKTTRIRTIYGIPTPLPANIHALDPATYFALTQPAPWYFGEGAAEEARQVLATPSQVLVTEGYLESAGLAVGDRFQVHFSVYNGTDYEPRSITMKVGGTVRGLPGLASSIFSGSIYGSLDTLGPLFATPTGLGAEDRYLVGFGPDADWRAVKDAILGLGATQVQVSEEAIAQLHSNPVFRGFFGFIRMEIAFMVVMLTAGLGLIFYAATLERDVEFAAMRARGASGWQTAGLLIGEAASIMAIGLLVGAGIGSLAAYLSNTTVAVGLGGGETLIPIPFTIPLEALVLLALAPVAVLAASFLVSIRVVRMDIGRVLKIRGG